MTDKQDIHAELMARVDWYADTSRGEIRHGSPNSLHGNWGDDEGNYYGHDPIAWMNLSVLERLATTPPQPHQIAEPASDSQ